MNLIELNMDKIIALCKKYKVSKLFVFGSILTNRFNKESDVDFIVNFDKAQVTDYFSNFFDLKYALEDILGREVDLLEEQTIKNPYLKKNVDATKTLIYRANQSINIWITLPRNTCKIYLMRLMTLKHFSRDNQNCLKNFVEIYVYKERLRGALKLSVRR